MPVQGRQTRTWSAGIGRSVITPRQPMWLSGYAARNRPAEGKLHDLWCKALALEDPAGTRCVLVTLDLVGIGRELLRAVQRRALVSLGITAPALRLACSHTHTGPVVRGNLSPMYQLDAEQSRFVDQYAIWLEDQIVRTIGEALRRLAPAELRYGSGQATFAVNRRNNKEPEVSKLAAEGRLQGPVDHDVPVLCVQSQEGKLLAMAFGYACHATVLDSYQWSGDYPGFAQLALEDAFPGATALFWAGCGGDQNPLPRRKVERAQEYGKRLAESVRGALKGKMQPVNGLLRIEGDEIPLAFDKLPREAQLREQIQDKNRFIALRAKLLLSTLAEGVPLSPYYPYPLQVWKLGQGPCWVALGGEVVVDYALRLKKELLCQPVWVNGYTNDVMAYIPSLRVLREGGYEGGGAMVYYGLPAPWSPDVEETIITAVKRLVAKS